MLSNPSTASRDSHDWGGKGMKKRQTDTQTRKLGVLGHLLEKPQHAGSLVCLLYTVDREVGLLHSFERGGGTSGEQGAGL